jgi:hypothetical protein
MWSLLDELLHDDPEHLYLAFCLIWWILLFAIPFVFWVFSRIWGKQTYRNRCELVAVLLCPICFTAIQLWTDWSLAGHYAPLLVYPLAVAGYASLVFLVWLSFRRWFVRLVCALLLMPVGLVACLSMTTITPFFGMFAFPHASGRLSTTVSWRTDWTSMSFTSDWVAYSIYTNPRWFPAVKHQIADARCDTSAIVDGNPAFRLSTDGKSVVVSCRDSDGRIANKIIQVR